MSRRRYPEELKIEAVKQVIEAGFSAYKVAERLGTTANSLYNWIRKYGPQSSDYQKASQESDEVRLMAVWKRNPESRVIDHADQGSQYTSYEWQEFLKEHNLQGSMSRRRNCHDNAVAKSFFQ